LLGWLALPAPGAEPVWPSIRWAEASDPAALGWAAEKLQKAKEYAESYSPTAVRIVKDGKVIASWGDDARKVNGRSIRKSLLGALYGIGVAEGRIKLEETIGELRIDDRPPSLS
jgi:CubicO group peptidase (beta-lactamase class C family)